MVPGVSKIWQFFLAGSGDTNIDKQAEEVASVAGNKGILEPNAKRELDKLKLEVANETLGRDMNTEISAKNYEAALDKKKWEAAEDLGLKDKIEDEGWENMTTGEVGKIGGKVGGRIGGQMVKELVAMAESQMAPVADEAVDKSAISAGSEGG